MSQAPRSARVERHTSETRITLTLGLDGAGAPAQLRTGIGFFDHMLDLWARHGLFDLDVHCDGDLHVDGHHTVEDVGLALGQAFAQALGDKSGIRRYGSITLPMDETLCTAAVDFSGRAHYVQTATFTVPRLGDFDTELVHDFWAAFAGSARCNLHLLIHYGRNNHHLAEAMFKSAARAMRQAVERDPRQSGVPSTKGVL
jgi:imidazoleglycerol-phosphate dehydratase